MTTVLFYISILLFSTFFVYISEKGKGRLERYTFLLIAFLIVFLPSGFRYYIGTDYPAYVLIYQNIEYISRIEPGYYYLNLILNKLNAHFQWVFIICSFIYTYISFKAYPKTKAWIIHFAIISLLYFHSFNIMRQAVALSFCLLATVNFFEKKYIKFIALTLVGSLFHASALLVAILGGLSLIPIRNSLKVRTIPLVMITTIIVTYLWVSIIVNRIEPMLALVGLERYSIYFGGRFFIEPVGGSGLALLVSLLYVIYILLNTKQILKLNSQYWLLIISIFFYGFFTAISSQILIFARAQFIFNFAPILSVYLLQYLPQRKQTHKAVFILYMIFIFLIFFKTSFGLKSGVSDPMLNPYQSIISL